MKSRWPCFTDDEISAVSCVLRSGRVNAWTSDEVSLFERDFGEYVNIEHCIAVSNGTVALELALRALGVGFGDEVIVTPRSFVASASCVLGVGAIPVFADIDSVSGNLSAQSIARCISSKTKAVVCVHLAGWPADMKAIIGLASKHGFMVVEDCSQAHGARIDDQPVGAFGSIATWSFCQDKIISTGGEGGMVATSCPELAKHVWELKDHGKDFIESRLGNSGQGYRWIHKSYGSNYRMLPLQAAIGRYQLANLDARVKRRRENAQLFSDTIAGSEFSSELICVPKVPVNLYHSYYKFYIYLKRETKLIAAREQLIKILNDKEVGVSFGSCPELYCEGVFSNLGLKSGFCPEAHLLGQVSLMFEIDHTLSTSDIRLNANLLNEALERVVGDDLCESRNF